MKFRSFLFLVGTITILISNSVLAKSNVAGFDFNGFSIRKALPEGLACPAVATAETDACLDVQGIISTDKDCRTLCSIPIAASGKVAGFDFNGFFIRKALPECMACPAVATAETDACLDNQGIISTDKDCRALCSIPIAASGKVAGFDFNGFSIRKALPEGLACAAIATAETDACLDAQGVISTDKDCRTLCSKVISR